jgi:hypothetical protein
MLQKIEVSSLLVISLLELIEDLLMIYHPKLRKSEKISFLEYIYAHIARTPCRNGQSTCQIYIGGCVLSPWKRTNGGGGGGEGPHRAIALGGGCRRQHLRAGDQKLVHRTAIHASGELLMPASAVIVCHPGTVSLLVLVPKEVGEVGGGLGEAARGEGDGRRSGR